MKGEKISTETGREVACNTHRNHKNSCQKGAVMNLTNEELLKMSDSSISQDVKDFICKQKMNPEEIAVCKATGTSPTQYMTSKSIEPN